MDQAGMAAVSSTTRQKAQEAILAATKTEAKVAPAGSGERRPRAMVDQDPEFLFVIGGGIDKQHRERAERDRFLPQVWQAALDDGIAEEVRPGQFRLISSPKLWVYEATRPFPSGNTAMAYTRFVCSCLGEEWSARRHFSTAQVEEWMDLVSGSSTSGVCGSVGTRPNNSLYEKRKARGDFKHLYPCRCKGTGIVCAFDDDAARKGARL